jgi:hypothetical protein
MTLIQFTVPSFKVRITYGTLCIAIAGAWLFYEFVYSAGADGLTVLAACAGIGAVAGLGFAAIHFCVRWMRWEA